MATQIPRRVFEHYDTDGVLARGSAAPAIRAPQLELESVKPADFRVSVRETWATDDGRTVQRIVFDHAESTLSRVLVDLHACDSPTEAAHALLQVLGGNQLRLLDRGSTELGFAVFEHPPEVAPAISFARGQFCVTVGSFGMKRLDVLPWALRIARSLGD